MSSDVFTYRELRSRTAGARERQRQSTREYLTERKAPSFQLVFDHPLDRPPLIFES